MEELILLDKHLEEILREFQKASQGKEFGATEKDCTQEEFIELMKNGFVEALDTSSMERWAYIAKLSYKGVHYFSLKKEYLRKKRKPKVWEWIRYGITTLIALAALAVSIIALLTK